MTETTCPLCGAPVAVDGTREQLYKYEPDASTMMGYDLRHLRIVAELLNSHNFAPQDLRDLVHNMEMAMNVARAEYERTLQHTLDEARKSFQTPHIEPWPVILPNCAEYVEEALEKAAKRPHTKAEVSGV
jgi:hypothetical protein